MKIYELPTEIQNRVYALQTEAGNTPDPYLSLIDNVHSGNFDWHASPEGMHFWKRINSGWYPAYYEKYPNIPARVYVPNMHGPSFAEHLTKEIIKDVPVHLSESTEEDLMKSITKIFDIWGIDNLLLNRHQIIDAYKAGMRERYSDLVNLLHARWPNGVFTEEDGQKIGISVMLTKFICEIAELAAHKELG